MRIAIGIEYDGSRFHGWQRQPSVDTVQAALEYAISEIAGEPTQVAAAGRTDRGVHALAQVAHFDTKSRRPLQAWVRGVNRFLPAAAAVRWAVPVEADFHARFSAIARSYRYVLFNHPVRPALQSGRVGWYHGPLDETLMALAARHLIGEHDFSSFRAAECQAKSPVKVMRQASIRRCGDYVLFDFRAGGFLHHMVRNLVGSLLWVGAGKITPDAFAELLDLRDRTRAAPTFAPDGLYFVGAEYDPRWRLPGASRIMAGFEAPPISECAPESRFAV